MRRIILKKRKEEFSLPNHENKAFNSGFSVIRCLAAAAVFLIKALFCGSPQSSGPGTKGPGIQESGTQGSGPEGAGTAAEASLTAEAAVALPVFLLCMMAVMQFLNVYNCAQRLGAAISQTAQEMAVGAYTTAYHEQDSLLGVVLSTAYATGRVYSQAGSTAAIRNGNFLLSGFLEEDELIDLVMTWQAGSPLGMVRMPWSVFIQRGAVRAWTGRTGSGGGDGHDHGDDHDHTTVYVAENGVVYHKDPNCTHIRLSIMPTTVDQAKTLRNVYREKYKPCERCGRHASGTVYITTDGNRYHSSLECSGLKRTVHTMHMDEAGNLRPCSKCGG